RQMIQTQTGELRIILTNRGAMSLQDVEVVLHLPRVLRGESTQPTGQTRGQEITWKLGSIGPRIRETFSVQVRALGTANAAVCHVTVLAGDGTGAAASCSLRIVPAE
ncbi:MAG: hypothetical protein NZM42_14555, partial [Gemmatales bacterium]|nr:hypothetical protein [Gemmatales bacterium]MDW8223559.1 hypothetical protein [Gemmatales bacterium]